MKEEKYGWNFCVNNDRDLTLEVKEIMFENGCPLGEGSINELDELFQDFNSTRSQRYYYSSLEQMDINKDVTVKMPEKTRFRFIKKCIKKAMKVSLRYQQEFNNSVYQIIARELIEKDREVKLIENIVKTLKENTKILREMQDYIDHQAKELEMFKEILADNKTKGGD